MAIIIMLKECFSLHIELQFWEQVSATALNLCFQEFKFLINLIKFNLFILFVLFWLKL